MTMKLTARRFRIRRPDPASAPPRPGTAASDPEMLFTPPTEDGFGDQSFLPPDQAAAMPAGAAQLDAIRREGLTVRQLRMARRLAQKHGLAPASDLDAVRLLRGRGIDPFQRSNLLDLLPGKAGGQPPGDTGAQATGSGQGTQLPQRIVPIQVPSTEVRAEQGHMADLRRIQQDLIRRRRRKAVRLAIRLFAFVGLPVLATAIYYFLLATPFYATHAEMVIQQSGAGRAGAGIGSLLQGTGLATSQDSAGAQGYLQSRDAMIRLDREHGFRTHFENPAIDPLQRLAPNATLETAYKLYSRNIRISYDPSEGIIKMEVIAANPEKAVEFANALVGYAEEQTDQLTQRMREDQMEGAQASYEDAEKKLTEAQVRVIEVQEKFKVLSSEVEVTLITSQIGGLETQLTTERLSLEQMESNPRPNVARMTPVRHRIGVLEDQIANLRAKLTEASGDSASLAVVQGELLMAKTDVETRQMLLAQALQAMEVARIEANRQVSYLSLSVSPVVPDQAAYPRAFEYTVVALLIFGGIYLMISMTVAILREQVSA